MPEANLINALVIYGPMGAMLIWFMVRLERMLNKVAKAVNLNSLAIIRLLERQGDHEKASELSKDLYNQNGGS